MNDNIKLKYCVLYEPVAFKEHDGLSKPQPSKYTCLFVIG